MARSTQGRKAWELKFRSLDSVVTLTDAFPLEAALSPSETSDDGVSDTVEAGIFERLAGDLEVRRIEFSETNGCPDFEECVSFDNTAGPNKADFSININVRHRDYQFSHLSRTYLVVQHGEEILNHSLGWLFDDFLEDGDTLVCLRLVDKNACRRFDPKTWKIHRKEDAATIMKSLKSRNHDNLAIGISLEMSAGKPGAVIQDIIETYEPGMLVIKIEDSDLDSDGVLSAGSVPKYCLQYSPVPVTIVNPEKERK